MQIGIIGAGVVGLSLGKALTRAGHQVMYSSRVPDSVEMQEVLQVTGPTARAGTPQEVLSTHELLAVAMPFTALAHVLPAAGNWQGKILIDMTNPFGSANSNSGAEDVAKLTGARVVKAFNIIGAEHYQNPTFAGDAATLLVAGDDVSAKETVAQLAAELGFDVVDAGGLAASRHLENLAELWVHLAMRTPIGRNVAFRLLR
jgi:8-hydroxy-5-deazaflavin:NADPH oxidoreductase